MPLTMPHDVSVLYDEAEERHVVLLDSELDSLPFDRIQCPTLKAIGAAWQAMPLEAGEKLPKWSCFRPVDFKKSLDKMCVLSVEDWRADKLEFTLYGNHPTEYVGLGKPLSLQELRTDPKRRGYYEDIRNRIGRAIDHEAPQYARKTLSWNDHGYIEYEILMLPFQRNGSVQRVLQPLTASVRVKGT